MECLKPILPYLDFEKSYGLEFMVRKRWGGYTNWMSYTLSKSMACFGSLNGGMAFPTDFGRTHHLKWNHHWVVKKWDFAVTYHAQSGGRYTPVASLTASGGILFDSRNKATLPSYHRFDVSIQYLFEQPRLRGSLGATMFNALDTRNHHQLQYSSIDNALRNRHLYALSRVGNVFVLLKF